MIYVNALNHSILIHITPWQDNCFYKKGPFRFWVVVGLFQDPELYSERLVRMD